MTQYRLTVNGVYDSGRTWSIRQHYASGASLSSIAADWQAAWVAAWDSIGNPLKAIYPTTTVFTHTTAATLVGLPYRETTKVTTSATHAGTSADDGFPDQDAIVVSRRTAQVGGRNRGRSYLPAPAETAAVGDILTTTVAGHIATAIDGVRTTMSGAGHTPVIYNVGTSTADPVAQTNKTITSEDIDRVIRTQRRRVRKVAAIYV